MKMPTMSSVFYLTDAGAPTLVLNKTTNRGGNKQTPIIPHKGYFSYPKKNRYFMFKGDLGAFYAQYDLFSGLKVGPTLSICPINESGA
jgi:hypothetical protein